MKNIKLFEQFVNEAKFNAKKLAKGLEKEFDHLIDGLTHNGKDIVEFTWWGGDDGVEVYVDCEQESIFLDDEDHGEWNKKIEDFGPKGIMDALWDWNSYN